MKRVYWFICLWVYSSVMYGQSLQERLVKAADRLQADSQMRHAVLGLSVVNSATGEKIFEVNAQMGLAPASCQKTITSAAAMELLGPQYRYRTILGYDGEITKGSLKGNLYLIGSGDPSLGSWRFETSKEKVVLKEWVDALQKKGIRKIDGALIGYNGKWETETLPGGWIWDDIGNYYGAGSSALNWHENQYDLILRSGNIIGGKVEIVGTHPKPYGVQLETALVAAAKGTGDNAYVYLPPLSKHGFVRGTIPVEEEAFTISGSFPDPSLQTLVALDNALDSSQLHPERFVIVSSKEVPVYKILDVYQSPSLDSLNYWFIRKSINLYGEALVKTIACEQTGLGSTDKGVELVKQFWKERGIESSALQIIDGSGLSPQNRVTADALVKVLQYARTRPWFAYYYDALPVFNQMKLKSGTIGGTKSFAGYHTAKDGTPYTVAFIINNYNGKAAEIVKKMYRLLDELK